MIDSNALKIIDDCEAEFETYKSDCSGFVKAVANGVGISLTGLADDIIDELKANDWTILADGVEAKNKADVGWLVIAGLKGEDHIPPCKHGHVAVIVSGPLARNKYPTGYWGSLGSVGKNNTTINYAWGSADRDYVIYSAKEI